MSSPLVSVVVSAYNRPDLLRVGLGSVLQQTYTNLEILMQDDSTNDACEAVVNEFADPRVSYVRNQPSLGTLRNLRAGYRRASGTYVCTLNDDDLYGPDYIQQMVPALEANPACCLGFADHHIIDEHGVVEIEESDRNSRRFFRSGLVPGIHESPLALALLSKSVPGMFALYRRDVMDFDDFPDEVSSGYDFWLVYLAVRSGRPVLYLSERLTSYRIHPSSQTSSFNDPERRLRSLAYDQFIHERFFADPRLRSIHPAVTQQLAKIHTSTGSALLRLARRRAAIREFFAALRLKPSSSALAGLALAFTPTKVFLQVLNARGVAAEQLR